MGVSSVGILSEMRQVSLAGLIALNFRTEVCQFDSAAAGLGSGLPLKYFLPALG